jgi:hypothetical protein
MLYDGRISLTRIAREGDAARTRPFDYLFQHACAIPITGESPTSEFAAARIEPRAALLAALASDFRPNSDRARQG